jgi:prevent-host-death family protein
MGQMTDQWQLQDAKNRFSEVVERALSRGAQVITRRGKKVVVVLPYQDYERMNRPSTNLAEFLLKSPFAESDIFVDRDKSLPRDTEIER